MNEVKKNYFFNLMFQVLNIVAPLITMPYVSRVLGAAGVGEYSYTYSIVSYFLIVASLGTSLYGCREISNNYTNKEKKSQVFWEILIIRICASSVVTLGYIILINLHKFSALDKRLLLINVLYIIGTALDISWLYQGEQRFDIITIFSLVNKIVTILLVFFLIKTHLDISKYVLIHASMYLINSVFYFIPLGNVVNLVSVKKLEIARHILPVLILLVPQISKEVYSVLDKTMIGEFYSDRSLNGYYEQAVNIVSMSMTIITSLNIVMMSKLSQDYSESKKENVISNVKNSFQFVWFIGIPLCVGIVSVIDLFVPLFFGNGYEPVINLVYILTLRILCIGISNVIGIQYLITLRRHRDFNISILVGLVANGFFNWILIPKYNVYGAAFATVISEALVTITQLLFVKDEISMKNIFPKEIIKRVIVSGIMWLVLLKVKQILCVSLNNYFIILFICIIIGGGIYIVIEIMLKDKMAREIKMLVMQLLQRKSG